MLSIRRLHLINDNDPCKFVDLGRFVRFGEGIILSTTCRVEFPSDNIASSYSEGDRLHFRPNKHVQLAVKINTEDKRREICIGMYTSFFKRRPRTNSTLPIHQISKSIRENKHGGETEETCMFTSFFKREPRTNSALPINTPNFKSEE